MNDKLTRGLRVDLPVPLMRQVKAAAALSDETIPQYVERALEESVRKPVPEPQAA